MDPMGHNDNHNSKKGDQGHALRRHAAPQNPPRWRDGSCAMRPNVVVTLPKKQMFIFVVRGW